MLVDCEYLLTVLIFWPSKLGNLNNFFIDIEKFCSQNIMARNKILNPWEVVKLALVNFFAQLHMLVDF